MNALGFDTAQLGLAAPLCIVSIGGLVLLMLEAFSRERGPRTHLAALTLVVLGLAALAFVRSWSAPPQAIFHSMLVVDRFSTFIGLLILVGAGLAVGLAGGFMREQRFEFGEFYALVLLATSGMLTLVQAADLVSLFIGLETMSLAVYVLTGSWRRNAKSSEAAMKYFLVGAFASALLIYGIALVYGVGGSTNLAAIGALETPEISDPVFLIGALFIFIALAFKIAAVPFHMWAPDAYEGAPTPVTAFMAATVKAAGFGALLRLVATAFARPELTLGSNGWVPLVSILAIATMTLGNVAALRQESVKRLLAYSSIAHAGYLLVGVAALGLIGPEARGPILYYLAAYTLTTVGSFGIVAWYGTHGDERHSLDDWAGLATAHPAGALAMTLLLLSLGGIPPTAGFFGKFYLFKVALGSPALLPLILVAVANSLISVFYYLRVVTAMYFREELRPVTVVRSTGMTVTLWIATFGTLALGLFPGWLVDLATQASLFVK